MCFLELVFILSLLELLIELGLVIEPQAFDFDEDLFAFWGDVLLKIEVEWDQSELQPATGALTYNKEEPRWWGSSIFCTTDT